MVDTTAIDLFLGLDLGKEFHHAHGRTGDGRTVHDKRLPNTEPKLLELFSKLVARFGQCWWSWTRSPTSARCR